MKTLITTLFCCTLILATACDKPKTDTPAADEPAAKTAEPEATPQDKPTEAPEALARVEVAEAGAKFDPAIKAEQLPEGAWYCDMGTVHWAAKAKPEDGKCPECGMMLKQYNSADQAAQKAKAIEAKDDDHGHEHGEDGEHGHEH